MTPKTWKKNGVRFYALPNHSGYFHITDEHMNNYGAFITIDKAKKAISENIAPIGLTAHFNTTPANR
jgi:hypothetical protein